RHPGWVDRTLQKIRVQLDQELLVGVRAVKIAGGIFPRGRSDNGISLERITGKRLVQTGRSLQAGGDHAVFALSDHIVGERKTGMDALGQQDYLSPGSNVMVDGDADRSSGEPREQLEQLGWTAIVAPLGRTRRHVVELVVLDQDVLRNLARGGIVRAKD